MVPRATPMFHVPDVRATIAWYELIGFRLEEANEIVISGPPGSGRTSLARALSAPLDLPVLDKDAFLERELAAERFVARRRHPGHGDRTRALAESTMRIRAQLAAAQQGAAAAERRAG
jgi:cytidylate kinase